MQFDTSNDAPFPITEDYVTIAITALPPGWRNVYEVEDGEIWTQDCPAILLQELRGRHQTYIRNRNDRSFGTNREEYEPPYETRTIFAENAYESDGELDRVIGGSHVNGGYLGTIGPNDPLPESKKKQAA